MMMAPVRTNDKRPNVKAFHVFNAIKANANGTSTAVLNFKPSKNGIMTFLTIFDERPVAANGILTSSASNDLGNICPNGPLGFKISGTFATKS